MGYRSDGHRMFVVTSLLVAAVVWCGCGDTMTNEDASGPTDGPQRLDGAIVGELEAGMQNGDASFDHSTFDDLLSEHADQRAGTVDYGGLAEEKGRLDSYLSRIADAELAKLPRDEQLALLVNAYNAYTLQLILENYPGVDSIRDISDPWSTERYEVGGHTLSLDQIEHGLIRPIYRDPRIHFAVNCAAVDCPYLAEFAYTGDAIAEQLDRRTKAILTNEQFVKIDGDELRYPRVMKWYRFDFVDSSFEGNADTVAGYVSKYATDEVRQFIEQHDGSPPSKPFDYDWSLNDTK